MKNSLLLHAFLLLATTAAVLAVIPGELVLAGSNSSSVGPRITLFPSTGYVGDNIQLIGSGFVPSQNIIISIDGSSILSYLSGWDGRWPVISDPEGSLGAYPPGKVICNVPNLPGGTHTVTAQDDAGDTATANILVLPKLTISKLQGAMGGEVITGGSGLQANVILSISFNNVAVATTKTDALGAYTQKFIVPEVPNGSYDVKITDGTTTQDFSFAVQSNAPVAPSQLSPGNGAMVRLPLPIAWAYAGSFGITYELQVSTDPGFTDVVFDKTGITSQSYTLADNLNAIRGNLYYWRVRAMYGWEGKGNWSIASTFRISSHRSSLMPIVLSSLAVIVLIVAAFFLIRLRKRSTRP